jgi:mannosyltransferase
VLVTESSVACCVTQEVSVVDVAQRTEPARERSVAVRLAGAASRRMPDWTLIVSPAVTLAVMLWGISDRPYWGDEADTISAVSRTVPQLFRLLGRIDAVHGFYYLLLWPVVQVAGISELVTRLPSALAMAAAAAGVTAIGRRLCSRWAGLCAGLVFAVLPTVTVQGQDVRPYAMVTAAAVLASYLLIRTAADPRPRWFAAYGLAVVLTGYLLLFALLVVPAHAVTLAALTRRPGAAHGPGSGQQTALRRWLLTVAAAGVVLLPVTIVSYAQRAQIDWIPKPGWYDARDLAGNLIAGSVSAQLVIGLLILLGLAAGTRSSRWAASPRVRVLTRPWLRLLAGDHGLAWLAVPWLVIPPSLLLAVSVIKPVYYGRYLTFCVPAVALLAGTGLAAMRWQGRIAALALVAALVAPAQLAWRVPGGGMQAVAQFLAAHEQPGDAIVYPESLVPPWYIAYPDGFAQLRDLSLSESPGASDRLFADTVPAPVLLQREQQVTRIWIVPERGGGNPASYLAPGFRLAHQWKLDGNQPVLLYVKAG